MPQVAGRGSRRAGGINSPSAPQEPHPRRMPKAGRTIMCRRGWNKTIVVSLSLGCRGHHHLYCRIVGKCCPQGIGCVIPGSEMCVGSGDYCGHGGLRLDLRQVRGLLQRTHRAAARSKTTKVSRNRERGRRRAESSPRNGFSFCRPSTPRTERSLSRYVGGLRGSETERRFSRRGVSGKTMARPISGRSRLRFIP